MSKFQKMMMRGVGRLNIALYRASGGRVMGKVRGMPLLLLTVAGRKTGKEHTTPVAYFEDGSRLIVIGSAGGAPAEPQWFRNLRESEQAVVEIKAERVPVTVSIVRADQHPRLWKELIAKAAFFAKYQDKVEREIPMAALTRAP